MVLKDGEDSKARVSAKVQGLLNQFFFFPYSSHAPFHFKTRDEFFPTRRG